MALALAGVVLFARPVAAAQARAGKLQLDPSKTSIEFQLPGDIHITHGTFQLKSGVIKADPSSGDAGGLIVVEAASGESGVDARDARMRDSILEADKYPEISFAPRHISGQLEKNGEFQAKLDGVMTLHGSEHPMVLNVEGRLVGDELFARADFSLPYVEWGLKDPSFLFFTVAKQVDIRITTSGHVIWTKNPDGNSTAPGGGVK